jgi:hypothetical protein
MITQLGTPVVCISPNLHCRCNSPEKLIYPGVGQILRISAIRRLPDRGRTEMFFSFFGMPDGLFFQSNGFRAAKVEDLKFEDYMTHLMAGWIYGDNEASV